jgi:hypothetical protein
VLWPILSAVVLVLFVLFIATTRAWAAERPAREGAGQRQHQHRERQPIKGIAAGVLALALTVAGLWRATLSAFECRTRRLAAWAVITGVVVALVGQGFLWLSLLFLCPEIA